MRNDLLQLAAYSTLSLLIAFGVTGGGTKSLLEVAGATHSAAAFFVTSITAEDIQQSYEAAGAATTNTSRRKAAAEKVRVLIVPGHRPEGGGAEVGSVTERDLVVDIAQELANLYAQNPRYEVTLSRGKEEWNPALQHYFDTHAPEITKFRELQIRQMELHLTNGSILPAVDQVYHNKAATPEALQLYGINKWANENQIDIVLHLHLNDYAGRRSRAGKYDGFAVYVPDRQYSNAAASKEIGTAIAYRLGAFHATSTLPQESKGVIEDQELIAIGANNSTDAAALLLEYGYIYEPQFLNASTRPVALKDYAYATYLGLQDFFDDAPDSYGSAALPYDWESVALDDGASGVGVYAVQVALRRLGFYPPVGESFSDCPVSGVAGPCTRAALKEYQRARGFEAVGTLGPLTRTALEHDLAEPEL